MKGRLVLVPCLLLLLFCLSIARFSQPRLEASNSFPVHNVSTGLNYATIQEAINANETLNGQTIFVDDGTYCEHVAINKSLTLIGESEDNTIVDGNGTGPAFTVTAPNVTLINFTTTNAGVPRAYTGYPDSPSPAEAILLNGTRYCLIEHVETSMNNFGFYLDYSYYNTILNCTCIGTHSLLNGIINASQAGIFLGVSNDNTISGNVVSGNFAGIGSASSDRNLFTDNQAFSNIWHGFDVAAGQNNVITCNQAWNNPDGILLDNTNGTIIQEDSILNNTSNGLWLIRGSSNNTVCENTIQNNAVGISGSSAPDTTNCGNDNNFYHNNIIGNAFQVYMPLSTNTWDAGYPSGGNYWSDYNGTDIFNGPYQNVSGSDGIGDSPYALPIEYTWNGTDRYPLMGMFSDLSATSQYHVQTVCNSTITDFQFNGTAISFNAIGENGTTGFCRISIPTALINGALRVFVNETEVVYSLLPKSNSTEDYLYFTYHHSTEQVIITMPEFPFPLILMLFIASTLVAVTASFRRRHTKRQKTE